MTVVDTTPAAPTTPALRHRRYLMCLPTFFDVTYAINPWMHPGTHVDTDLAITQWEGLRQTYLDLGHEVQTIEPIAGLPDMVFAANGGLVIGDRAFTAKFVFPERQPEGAAYAEWFRRAGIADVFEAEHTNEGEGDFLTLSDRILAGTGFRTSIAAHEEVGRLMDRPVVPLKLVDPRFYHLDTALAVLDDGTGTGPSRIAYFPGAFSRASQVTLQQMFPDAIAVSEVDACTFGLNAVSDGHYVVLPATATHFAARLRDAGFEPIPVQLGELLKAGGSVKCCTLELRP
ncbi:dimethylarginine dimethylaminohydrolase family protein [soil metagenome]